VADIKVHALMKKDITYSSKMRNYVALLRC